MMKKDEERKRTAPRPVKAAGNPARERTKPTQFFREVVAELRKRKDVKRVYRDYEADGDPLPDEPVPGAGVARDGLAGATGSATGRWRCSSSSWPTRTSGWCGWRPGRSCAAGRRSSRRCCSSG